MKKKIIITSLSIALFLGAALLFFVYHPSSHKVLWKIMNFCRVVDLRKNLPKGEFRNVSIVQAYPKMKNEYICFEVPADKMKEFEAGFRRCIQDAILVKGIICCLGSELRIQTDKEKYCAYICWDDDEITFLDGIFHHGMRAKELRKVFYNAGLKYTAGCPKEKEANELEQ